MNEQPECLFCNGTGEDPAWHDGSGMVCPCCDGTGYNELDGHSDSDDWNEDCDDEVKQ